MDIKIKRVSQLLVELPKYETEGSAGMDLRACIPEGVRIYSGDVVVIPCGISVEIPTGYELQIRPRSGLASKYGITVINAPGTIDSDFRGEICVALVNMSNLHYVVMPNDRIAQMVLAKVERAVFVEVQELSDTARGEGGMGSTGRQ